MRGFLADYHIHSRFSPDSQAELADICQAALERGLAEIAITDHYEFFQEGFFRDKPYRPETLLAQQAALEECREQFSGQLAIRRGVELGQPQANPKGARALLGQAPFDYVIGSVHKLANVDLGLIEYPRGEIPRLVSENLDMLWELADSYDFDCLGHLDIIKRYAAVKGEKIDLMDWRDQVEPLLQRLIQRGKGLEINTSGLRQAAREALPSLALLRLYRSLGGEILTLGSDAHRPEDIAADFETALEMAKAAGFSYLAAYENRSPRFERIE